MTGNIEADPDLECVNSRKTDDLKITKIVKAADGVALPEPADSFKFTITIDDMAPEEQTFDCKYEPERTGAGDNKVTFENGKATVDIKGGETIIIEKLPSGASYTVEETPHENYEINSDETQSGVIGVNKKITFENIYQAKNTKAADTSTAVQVGDTITYTITWHNNSTADLSDVVIIDTLPDELDFVKAEGDFINEDNKITWTIGNVKGLSTITRKITVRVNEKALKKEFINTAIVKAGEVQKAKISSSPIGPAEKGTLTISKKIEGFSAEDTNNFTFTIFAEDKNGVSLKEDYDYYKNGEKSGTISFADDPVNITLKGSESIVIHDLPAGAKVTVTEAVYPGQKASVNGEESTESNSYGRKYEETIITDGNTAEFVNTKLETAALSITKTVESALQSDLNATYTFNVTLTAPEETVFDEISSYTAADISGLTISTDKTSISGTIELGNGGTARFTGLPKGTAYEVTEQPNEDTKLKSSVKDGNDSGILNEDNNVEFVNSRKNGSLKISKDVMTAKRSFDVSTDSFTFKINVPGIADGEYSAERYPDEEPESAVPELVGFINGTADVTLKNGETILVSGLPDGAAYTVSETANTDYYTLVNGVADGTAVGNIDPDNTAVVDVINIYKSEPSKTLITDISGGIHVGDLLTYDIIWYNNSNNVSDVVINDTLPEQLDYFEASSDVPGSEITNVGRSITWTIHDQAPLSTGKVTVTARVNENALRSGFKNEAVVEAGGHTYNVSSGDVNAAEKGDIIISKTVSGSLADKEKDFTFTITAADKSGTKLEGDYAYDGSKSGTISFADDPVNITLRHGQSITIKDLPAEAKVTVEETAAEGYDTTVTVTNGNKLADNKAELTVASKTPVPEAAFNNRRDGADRKYVDPAIYGNAVYVGDTITYVIKWNNNSDEIADIIITDKLADGLEPVLPEGDTDITYYPDTNTVEWTLKKCEAGSQEEVRLTVKVNEAAVKWDGTNTAVIRTADPVSGKDIMPKSTVPSEDVMTVNKGNIAVTKRVTGTNDPSELNRYFAFTINANAAGVPLSGSYDFNGTIGMSDSSGAVTEVTDGSIKFEAGTANIFLKDGQSIEIIGLPASKDSGYDFTITETAVPGYTASITPTPVPAADSRTFSGNVPINGTVENANIVYTNNKLAERDLTVRKIVEGKDGETEREWEFEVELTAPAGTTLKNEYTVGGNASGISWRTEGEKRIVSFKLVNGRSAVIRGLPDGTSYDIIENDLPGNYQVRAQIDDADEVVLADSDGSTVKAAKLSSVSGADSISNDKTVIITNESPIPIKGEGRYSLTKKVSGVKADPDTEWHFNLKFGTVSGTFSYTKTGKTAESIFEQGTIEVENGNIVSIKVEAPEGTFTEQPDKRVMLKNDETITFYRLPSGTNVSVYETEANSDGYETTVSQNSAFVSADVTEKTPYKTAVPDQDGVKVIITNKRMPGRLSVSSEVVDERGKSVTDDSTEFVFDITIKDEDNNAFDADFYEKFKNVEWKIDEHGLYTGNGTIRGKAFEIGDLPDGTRYSVRERPAAGYRITEGADGYSGTIQANEASNGKFVNTKIDEVKLEISKKIESDISADKTRFFDIGIKLTAPEGTILADTYSYTVSNSEEYTGERYLNRISGADGWEGNIRLRPDQTASIVGLPRGTRFEIYELSASEFNPDISLNNTALEDDTEVVVTNRRKTADLTISKTISSDSEITALDKSVPFDFKVSFTQPDGTALSGKYDHEIYDESDNVVGRGQCTNGDTLTLLCGQKAVIKGLPLGAGYTVEEISDHDGYVPADDEKSFTGIISETPDNNIAAFENIKKTGTLTISKKVVHSDNSELSENSAKDLFTFEIEMYIPLPDGTKLPVSGTFGDCTFENGKSSVLLTHEGKAVISEIPLGTEYTVSEKAKDGYTTTVNGSENGTVNASETVEYTNIRSVGSLTVTKTVENVNKSITDIDSSKVFDFVLTLTNADTDIDGIYNTDSGKIEISDGKGEFTLRAGESLKIEGIPTGTAYTVQELPTKTMIMT